MKHKWVEDYEEDVEDRIKKNLSHWGIQDIDTLALAIAEEAGEICRAVLEYRTKKTFIHHVHEETLDLAALCKQMILRACNIECGNLEPPVLAKERFKDRNPPS